MKRIERKKHRKLLNQLPKDDDISEDEQEEQLNYKR